MANFKMYAQNPVVAFGCNKINLYTSDTITFINTSTGFTNTTKFIWNFGMACGLNPNGTPILDGCNDTTTGNQTILKTFTVPGTFKVSLKAIEAGITYYDERIITVNQTMAWGCSFNACNLVGNGGFEDISACPNTAMNLGAGPYTFPPTPGASCFWFYPTTGSPDLYINTNGMGNCTQNTLLPNEPAPNGVGMAGFFIWQNGGNYREYIEQRLQHALQRNKTYHVSFWARLRSTSCATSNLQVSFTHGPVADYQAFQTLALPVGSLTVTTATNVTQTWQLFDITFTPTIDCLDHIIIGNIANDNDSILAVANNTCPTTSGFVEALVDQVSVYAVNGLDAIITNACSNSPGSINLNEPCNTATTTFTPPYTYNWSNGATTQDLTNVPAGFYQVLITSANGNILADGFTINTGNLPPVPILTGNHDACNIDHVVQVKNPNPLFIYSWTTDVGISGFGTSCNIDFNTTTGLGAGIITFIVTDPTSCCSNSATFIVAPCCQPFSGTTGVNLDLSNLSASTLMQNIANYPGFVVYNPAGTGIELITDIAGNPSYQAAINGVFLVDIDMNIAGSNVVLGPGARIKVINGATLTISEGSWLHTCNQQYMWDRIDVVAGCAIIIRKDVLIEEAETAVVLHENATISSKENVTFNRNYKSIEFIGNYNSQYNKSAIANTKFTSINLTTNTLAPIGVPPYAAVRSHIGISATNLLGSSSFIGLQIGNYTTNNPMAFGDVAPNIFNNLDLGIDAENCDLAVYNCNFYNINDDLKPTDLNGITGTAISSVGIKTLQPASTTTIGGNFIDPLTNPVTLMPNNFVDCKRGVFIAETNATVAYNHFLRNTYTGIAFKNGAYYQVTADSNDFINCNRGIAAREMGNATILISRNYYNVDNNYAPANTLRYDRIAFSINNGVKGRVAGYMQNNNYCKGFKACFVLTNVDGYTIAFNNPIIMDMNGPGSPYGMRILGGDGNRLYNNKIEYNGSNSSTNTLWRGISIETCANTLIFSNTMQKLGTGLRFFNCNAQQFVQCNNFDACYRGVELNSSYIGNQGHNNQPNPEPNDNQWFNQPSGFLDAIGVGNFTNSIWWFRNTFTNLPLFQSPAWSTGAEPILTNTCTGTLPFSNCTPPLMHDEDIARQLAVVATNDGFMNNLNFEMQYKAKVDAYITLFLNPNLKELGLNTDETLKLFFDSINGSNGGELMDIYFAMQANQNDTATQLLNYFLPENSIEEYAEIVNRAYLMQANSSNDEFEFDMDTYNNLDQISLINPIEGGYPVYQARVLLDRNINDDFNGYSLRLVKTVETKPSFLKVFPNPSSGNLVIIANGDFNISKLEIINAQGVVVAPKITSNNEKSSIINMNDCTNGMYIIKVILEDGSFVTTKINLLK